MNVVYEVLPENNLRNELPQFSITCNFRLSLNESIDVVFTQEPGEYMRCYNTILIEVIDNIFTI